MPASRPSDIRKHEFVPDITTDGATCEVCSMPYPFGALHVEAPDDAADGYELPPMCSDCLHYAHNGPCQVLLTSWPKPVACHCGQRKAEAA